MDALTVCDICTTSAHSTASSHVKLESLRHAIVACVQLESLRCRTHAPRSPRLESKSGVL
jgi:hypothetical protein